jgi:CUB domain
MKNYHFNIIKILAYYQTVFIVTVMQVIKLNLNFIAISDPQSKVSDYVYVYDGNSYNSPPITTLYGSYKTPLPSIMSSQRFMFIRFRSDNYTTYNGFNMTWISADPKQGKRSVQS